MSHVIADEMVVFGNETVAIGPYYLDDGHYHIWIEDYFPGFDGGEVFDLTALFEGGDMSPYAIPNEYRTRTIDGVDCEEAAEFYLDEGYWVFEIQTHGETMEENAIHVFVVREPVYRPTITFGVGMACVAMGLIMIGLIHLRRKREKSG
jgi:hypothetical protein